MAEEVFIKVERKEIPLDLSGRKYKLVEMDGIELGGWRDRMSDRLKFGSSGAVVGVKTSKGNEALLIAECLYDDTGVKVKYETILNWPISVQMKIVRMCRDLNGLTEEPEAEKK